MKTLCFAGPDDELGVAIGEEWREDIASFIEHLRSNLNLRAGLHVDEVEESCRRSWSRAYEHSPGLQPLLEGIATGANVNVTEIEFVNSFMELISYRASIVRNL